MSRPSIARVGVVLAALVPVSSTFAQDSTWVLASPPTAAPKVSACASAYDPVSGRVIVFGGTTASGYSSDTYAFDGVTWTKLTLTTHPTARAASRMTFDEATQKLVMFGGYFAGTHNSTYFAETWIFDGAANTWTKALPAHSPVGVTGPVMFTDPTTGSAMEFGGFNGQFYQLVTWRWTGADWQQLSPANTPSARAAALAALDPTRHQVVMYGGLGSVNPDNTWVWNGADWLVQSPTTQPPLRYDAGAVFDPRRGTVVAFGGAGGFLPYNDAWEWTGSDWQMLSPQASPPGRNACAIAYHAGLHRIVIASGNGASSILTDTWTFVDEFFPAGPGLAGTLGTPTLSGSGDLTPGSATGFTITLGNELPSTNTLLFASLGVSSVPLAGGLLYPFPVTIVLPVATGASGGWSIPATIPPGVPSNTTFYMQVWCADPGGPLGANASNGLGATVP